MRIIASLTFTMIAWAIYSSSN